MIDIVCRYKEYFEKIEPKAFLDDISNKNLLIDEPTNHLDSETRNNLVEYLNKKKGFILVSHDRLFFEDENDKIKCQ